MTMTTVTETLVIRGSKYGESFAELASIAQNIKCALKENTKWEKLSADKKEALEMIATKLARIVYGDPEYDDNYRDICGYSQLVLDEITKNKMC
jgi:hypothetical protein